MCVLKPYCINQINRSLLFFFLNGISSVFVFLEISVARSSSIEEKRCGGKLFNSLCVLNAEILTHFSTCFTYCTSFIPTSKCHILIIYTWSRNRGDRDTVTTGLLTEYPDVISDLWDESMYYWTSFFTFLLFLYVTHPSCPKKKFPF